MENQEREREKEYIYSYPDGSVYMGHMRNNQRHGRGTLRTPAFVYGFDGSNSKPSYTSDEAEENAHLVRWHEYAGTWENDKLHGYGVHIQKSGTGAEIIIFEGEWSQGRPVKSIHAREKYTDEDTIFG